MRTFFILVPTFYPHYILRAGTIAYVEVLHDRRICIKTSALNSLRFSINSVVIPITRPYIAFMAWWTSQRLWLQILAMAETRKTTSRQGNSAISIYMYAALHCWWEDKWAKEMTGNSSSCDETKNMTSPALQSLSWH